MHIKNPQPSSGWFVDRRQFINAAAAVAATSSLGGGTWSAEVPAADNAGPWVYWYWMNANITREGIVGDLTAMHAAGIAGVYLFNIGGLDASTLVPEPAESQSPLWWELLRFATAKAGELGMGVAMNICDGWGTAGGAWVTPERSAKELVWREQVAKADATSHRLEQPTTHLGFYRDIATFAYPINPEWLISSDRRADVTSSWPVANVERITDPQQVEIVVDTEEAGWIQYSFDAPFMLRSLTVRTPSIPILPFLSMGYNGAANSFAIEASDDGRDFKPVFTLQPPQLGWQSNATELAHSLPPTRARHFRFIYKPDRVATAAGDGRMPVTRRLRLASLSLSGRPVVGQLPIRTGTLWGKSAPLDDVVLPANDCIAAERLIDLSEHVAADGTLQWRTPPGLWMLLRIGTTSNGVITSPSGKAGGLECDKFDPAAVQLQFEKWFGAALDQVGPALAGKVLRVLHVDSWEARSQSWSPLFPDAFKARGYDLRPWLPTLTGVPIGSGSRSERFLFDSRRTIAELLRDNCFAVLARLTHERGCQLSAQQTNASFVSDGMQHFQHVDLPCGEFWKGRPASDKPSDIREAVSAAHLYGKRVVTAEAFTGQLDWSEHPFSFKAQGDQHFCIGINRFILHVWAHQAFPERSPGVTMYNYGSFFSGTQPWWPMAAPWIAYLHRCQDLLQQGSAVVDVCYYTGEDIPTRAYLPDALAPSLPAGYTYDSINADALLRLAEVRDGRIVLPGGPSYVLLVLPKDMPTSAPISAKLSALKAAGGNVHGPSALPTLAPLLQSLGIAADVSISGSDQVHWTHRRDAKRDLYLLSHQGDASINIVASFRITGRTPTLYDAVHDRWTLPVSRASADRVEIPLTLASAESVFIVFDGQAPSSEIIPAGSIAQSALPVLSMQNGQLVAETYAPGSWEIRTSANARFSLKVPRMSGEQRLSGPKILPFVSTPARAAMRPNSRSPGTRAVAGPWTPALSPTCCA
jgi:alpha-L-rhamnosidase